MAPTRGCHPGQTDLLAAAIRFARNSKHAHDVLEQKTLSLPGRVLRLIEQRQAAVNGIYPEEDRSGDEGYVPGEVCGLMVIHDMQE